MDNTNNNATEQEVTEFLHGTSALVAAEQSASLEKTASGLISIPATQMTGTLVNKVMDDVEFWKLFYRDYSYMSGGDVMRGLGWTHNLKNASRIMQKSGAIGFVVGAGVEALTQYRRYKNGEISGTDYLKSIAVGSGYVGTTAAATSGIMIPVQVALKAAGLASPIVSIPVGFAVAVGVDKIVAPIFKRGQYAVQLEKAKFYSDLNIFYHELADEIESSGEAYRRFIIGMIHQQLTFNQNNNENAALSEENLRLTKELEAVLNSI
jgi:hypothetical protein